MIRTRCYRDGKLKQEGFAVEDVSALLADDATVVWFDLCGDDARHLEVVRRELGLHDLAIEDVGTPGQRPKLDHYPEHLFLVAYSLEINTDTGVLTSHEISAFITPRALVTVRADEGFALDEVIRRWDAEPQLASSGVSYLIHGLLDYVVDTHFRAVEQLDSAVDGLEDQVFDEVTSDAQMQRRTFQLRKSLVSMRRLVLPMREVVNTLLRRDLKVIDQQMVPYYQDVYDHVLRVSEWTDSLRDLIANILETRLTVRSNRLNVIMKKVTSWAAIIAIPTAVTGYFGQNISFPGFGTDWGVWLSFAVMLVSSVTLYITFKTKGWL